MNKTQILLLILICFVAGATWLNAKSDTITVGDGTNIHFIDKGKGETIVFIPGWTFSVRIWKEQIDYFSRKYRVIAIDPRGQGSSDKPSEGNYAERRARDYKDLLDSLGVKSFHFVAWSMAGADVLTYATIFGGSGIKTITLADCFLGKSPNIDFFTGTIGWLQWFQTDRRGFTELMVKALFKTEQKPGALRDITEDCMKAPTSSAFTLMVNNSFSDFSKLLPDIKVPMQFFYQKDTDPEQPELFKKHKPDSPLIMFENSSHGLMIDESQKFNQTIEEFIMKNSK